MPGAWVTEHVGERANAQTSRCRPAVRHDLREIDPRPTIVVVPGNHDGAAWPCVTARRHVVLSPRCWPSSQRAFVEEDIAHDPRPSLIQRLMHAVARVWRPAGRGLPVATALRSAAPPLRQPEPTPAPRLRKLGLRDAVLRKRLLRSQFEPLVLSVARALATAHERGITHREVKPTHILFTSADAPCLIDMDAVAAVEHAPARLRDMREWKRMARRVRVLRAPRPAPPRQGVVATVTAVTARTAPPPTSIGAGPRRWRLRHVVIDTRHGPAGIAAAG